MGISTQYSAMTYARKDSTTKWIYLYVYLIHYAVQ